MKLRHPALLLSALTLTLLPLVARADTLAEREAQSLANFRKNPNDSMSLENVALIREEIGYYDKARATWGLISKNFGNEKTFAYSITPGDKFTRMSYGELAKWTIRRLERKRNLRSNPVTRAQKSAAFNAAVRFMRNPPVKYLDASRDMDIDGDGIDEVVIYGRSGPLGKGKRNSMSIYKWDGQNTFRPIWKLNGKMPVEIGYGDQSKDEMKDGFAEITLVYTPHSDDVTRLQFNGTSFMTYVSP